MKTRDIVPPEELVETIYKRIHEKNREAVRMRLIGTSMLAAGSLISIVPSVTYLFELIKSSGSYEYLSLIISDAPQLASYWKEFTLSIAESFPLLALTLSLSLFALFMWSLAKTARNVRVLAA